MTPKAITPAEIDAMPAGRDLDMLVAEKIMGWEHDPESPYFCHRTLPNGNVAEIEADWIQHYSTNIADTWDVVAAIWIHTHHFECVWRHDDRNQGWVAQFGRHSHDNAAVATGETAPLAICRAALHFVTKYLRNVV